jgi:glycosyltransferase involved in cell wall biosynthesis
MKILWLTNAILPAVAGRSGSSVCNTIGWTDRLSEKLISDADVSLVSMYPDCGVHAPVCGEDGDLKWYGFYSPKIAQVSCDNKRYEYFRSVLMKEKPDIVHIWGTEYSHTAEMTDAAKGLAPVVISVQGLISECAKVYTGGIPETVVSKRTFHDSVRRDGIAEQKARFEKRGELEIKALKEARYVIGRTDWDRSNVTRINPDIVYYDCGEILRDVFYTDEVWSYDRCDKHSIFMSQAYYPIKGMHIALEVLHLIKKEYPDVVLRTTGRDPRCSSLTDRLRQNTFERYISEKIREYDLDDNVKYIGGLDAEGMKKMYLKSNVFLQASLLENSSNSLGEAMITGCPVVATNVGGTSSVLGEYGKAGLFDVSDPGKAAEKICDIFNGTGPAEAEELYGLRQNAKSVYDADRIAAQYRECYADIIGRRA